MTEKPKGDASSSPKNKKVGSVEVQRNLKNILTLPTAPIKGYKANRK